MQITTNINLDFYIYIYGTDGRTDWTGPELREQIEALARMVSYRYRAGNVRSMGSIETGRPVGSNTRKRENLFFRYSDYKRATSIANEVRLPSGTRDYQLDGYYYDPEEGHMWCEVKSKMILRARYKSNIKQNNVMTLPTLSGTQLRRLREVNGYLILLVGASNQTGLDVYFLDPELIYRVG